MKRNSLNLLCVLVVGALFVAAFAPVGLVGAGPGQQHNIYGLDAQSGADVGGATSISSGSRITAWIDGVSYGLNTTIPAYPSRYDLYVEGDDWGVDPDDWVKDGGYNGDTVQYFLDYDPSDYYLQISDFTSTFEEGAYQNESSLFFDTQTNTDIAIGDTYLRGLKINEVVFDPWAYVYIYDPGGDLSEAALEDAAKGYYIQKDDPTGHTTNGPIFDFNTLSAHVIQNGPPNYYYINISQAFTLGSQDELKLVWKNPGTSGDNIANGTDVVVDRVEWGNYHNQHAGDYSWRDYDNTTLPDILGSPAAGQCFRLKTNGTDNDNPFNDFGVYARSPWPIPPDNTSMPGSPSDLLVHKSGTDLNLEWLSPIVDHNYLVKNIVYYDSDLSDGFQYTSYQIFDPTDSGPGTTDSVTLTGMLADGNDYAFVVRTTGDTTQGGPYENPIGTNIGYKYVESLMPNTPPTTSQKFISVPYLSDWAMASDISGPGTEFTDGGIITAVLRWNYASQKFDSRTWLPAPFNSWNGDFTINPGDALAVGVATTLATPYDWKVVGAYDDTIDFTFDPNTPPLTSQIFTSIPYHTSYTMASDIAGPGREFTDGSVITAVLQWNYALQKFDSRTWLPAPFNAWNGDFTIDSFPGGHIAFGISTTLSTPYIWQPEVISL